MKTGIYILFILLIVIIGCQSKEIDVNGKYILSNPDEERIAEILELNKDSSFFFSGLKIEKEYSYTWIIEGTWQLRQDTIILNTGDQEEEKGYGDNINLKYLKENYAYVNEIEQHFIVCKNYKFHIKNEQLSILEGGRYNVYKKKKP